MKYARHTERGERIQCASVMPMEIVCAGVLFTGSVYVPKTTHH